MTMSKATGHDLPSLKKILVIGSGGRENSLAWALKRCPEIEEVWVTPGNGGTEEIKGCKRLTIKEEDIAGIQKACSIHQINFVIIGPEAPLAKGVADQLRALGLAVFGPDAEGAQLEASKDWAKNLMNEAGIPTAKHWTVTTETEALKILYDYGEPLVVKVDGLASGKGVTVAKTIIESEEAIKEAFAGRFGSAGRKLVLEEQLQGPEVSLFALTDGEDLVLLPPAQDHKRLAEGDEGPNTGGMGAYAPAPLLNSTAIEHAKKTVLEPTLEALKKQGIDYRGVIYAGLMITKDGPKVIEFNCRFGDPECQTLMPMMGPQLAKVLYACALGKLSSAPKLMISDCCSACVVAAASGYPNTPRKNDQIRVKLNVSPSVQIFHAGTTKDSNSNLFTSGGRVLSVVAQGEDFDKAFSKAYSGLEQIHFKGMVYRTDIGHQVRQFFTRES
ncbi:phosphoribosylamine--glycine ligase [Prochlorococcus sp. MIT 1300]|uniref:phosphoribosylamine--glycine ligase n=1 Tax=Prochlorococcus sp. MIT 1300 TaxID=3096218 RepID=UPI002A751C92|nr:phosphoribosylamine--glycine ligase [Prochlorococcus sp. MIT 1300]